LSIRMIRRAYSQVLDGKTLTEEGQQGQWTGMDKWTWTEMDLNGL
jgi:hypothetical protein